MRTWKDDADIADDWQHKGDQGWELTVRRSAIRTALHAAVRKPEDEAVAWLKQHPILAQLQRLDELVARLGHADDYTDVIDMALVIGERQVARRLIDRSTKPYGPLWTEYRKALLALLDQKRYEQPRSLPAKGWITTFVSLLPFAAALSKGEDTSSAESALDEAFAKRNRDKRLVDPVGMDGDGQAPASWNLRKRALRAAAGGA